MAFAMEMFRKHLPSINANYAQSVLRTISGFQPNRWTQVWIHSQAVFCGILIIFGWLDKEETKINYKRPPMGHWGHCDLGLQFYNRMLPTSVTSKDLPNVYQSCPKMISLCKIKDFDNFTKIVATGFEKFPKVQ